MKKYWMCHVPGTSTTYMHRSREEAVAEARRLHRVIGGHPNVAVLETVGIVEHVAPEIPRIDPEPADEEHGANVVDDLPY